MMFGCWLLAELKAGGDSGGTGGGCDKEFIVESVFRTGQTRTRREIEKVRGEWALVCMTHNISEVLQDVLPSAQQFRYIEVTKAVRRRRSAQSNNERPETI